MTKEEIDLLVERYFNKEGYTFPGYFEHRLEPVSSGIMYSIIRKFKPKRCLEIGAWHGGSACLIMGALLKNDQPFEFYSSELLDDLRNETEDNVFRKFGQTPIMLGDITKNLGRLPELDFVFVDTDHDLNTTKWIVEHIWPLLKPGALFCMHDWAVVSEAGKLKGKGDLGVGGWPETQYLMDLHEQKKFPFEKIFWTYKVTGNEESGFWLKI